jgi:hypothetical protein
MIRETVALSISAFGSIIYVSLAVQIWNYRL